jgi:ADP-ribose pyrophosphatase
LSELRPWRITTRRTLAEQRVFALEELQALSPRTAVERPFWVLHSNDWVNVIPLTDEGEVVMVRQWRHGTGEITLEIPGGLIETGEAPAAAAVRELCEETGHAGDRVESLGVVTTNPALFDNRTHTFLISGCRRVGALEQDLGEDIAVETVALARIPALIADGTIKHSLVIAGFWWLAARRSDLLPLGGAPAPAAD